MIEFTIETCILRPPATTAHSASASSRASPSTFTSRSNRPSAGALLRFHAHGRLTGTMRLAQPLLQRVLKRQFARQCATLKDVLEA